MTIAGGGNGEAATVEVVLGEFGVCGANDR